MIFNAEDGGREPFDPQQTGRDLAGCLLCGQRRIIAVGLFVPKTDATRAAILRLRDHPMPERTTPCVSYGICVSCLGGGNVTARVEAVLVAAAAAVTIQ